MTKEKVRKLLHHSCAGDESASENSSEFLAEFENVEILNGTSILYEGTEEEYNEFRMEVDSEISEGYIEIYDLVKEGSIAHFDQDDLRNNSEQDEIKYDSDELEFSYEISEIPEEMNPELLGRYAIQQTGGVQMNPNENKHRVVSRVWDHNRVEVDWNIAENKLKFNIEAEDPKSASMYEDKLSDVIDEEIY